MKKLLNILLALVACCMLATVAAADAAEPDDGDIDVSTVWNCAYCQEDVTWTAMPDAIPETPAHYHYYLTEAITPSQLLVKAGVTLCLDLKGQSISTDGRSFIVYTGSLLSIMDSSASGSGYIQGSRGNNNGKGGTVTVQDSAELNLYSGTLRFLMDDAGSQQTYQAGVVWVKSGGMMNMYGGTVEGGELMQYSTNTSSGGAISVSANGQLNVSGGKITSGILPEGGKGPCVYMEANTARITLSGDANIQEIYAPAGSLTVSGEFTGKARLYLSGTPSAGLAVGFAMDATLSGDLFCTNGNGWNIEVAEDNLALTAYTASAERHFCAHCKEVVKWTAMPSSWRTLPTAHYHFYLASNSSSYLLTPNPGKDASTPVTIDSGEPITVCLDLYGKHIATDGRALGVYRDSVLSIMDSSEAQSGYICGSTAINNTAGGTLFIKGDAQVNLYSGTLKFQKDDTGTGCGTGGVMTINDDGILNIYGGTIEGAELVTSTASLTKNGFGGAIFLYDGAIVNAYGGQITSGSVPEGGEGACIYVNGKNAELNLCGSSNMEDICFRYENDQLTVSGTYTGTVNITYPSTVTLTENLVVGKAGNDADVTAAALTCGNQWVLGISGSDLVLVPNNPAVVCSADGTQTYATVQAAIDNAGSGYVKLLQSVTEDITVSRNLYLDLNGKTVTGTVTVEEGAILYGMDSQTDDYTVNDAAGYGTLTVAGAGQVLGLPEESDIAEHGYMKITEDDGISFHAVNLKLTAMTLRAESAGVYYKSNFGGDELVAARVTEYGVALSVKATPTAENLESDCKRSVLTGFTAGGMDEDATSTLLKGVMKDTNAALMNNRNAQLPVYGRAYILTEDGYLFGAAAQRSFKEQVESVDDIWSTLNATKKASVVSLYDAFRSVMKTWDIPNVIAQKDPSGDGIMKILGIGNSYTIDSMHLLNAVYQAEKPGTKLQLGIAYYSGCRLDQHVKYYNEESAVYTYYYLDSETGTWVTTKEMTLQDIISAQNWDLVSMQQGSGTSGVASTYNSDIQTIQKFVDKLLGYTPTFFWNMTWAYPETDIPTDSYTLENAPNANNFKNNYGSSQETMYNMIMATVQEKIVPDTTFKWIMPVGTAVQNAQSSYMTDLELYRDYTHLSDFARLMAAYTWYCQLEGTTLDSVQLTYVPDALTKSYTGSGDMVLSDSDVNVLVESVKNACTTMFEVTPSVYTAQ